MWQINQTWHYEQMKPGQRICNDKNDENEHDECYYSRNLFNLLIFFKHN